MKRLTYFERRWPNTPRFQELAKVWCEDQSRGLLDLVWQGFDLLFQKDLSNVPVSPKDETIEETLNALLCVRISECLNGFEPFTVFPEPPELARRKGGKAKPPKPDLGFVMWENLQCVWPLEGKVLKGDRAIAPYVKEIKVNFLTGRYATFSSEGAMVGYLLKGDPKKTFKCLEQKLMAKLTLHQHFPNRDHRLSHHSRQTLPDPNSPKDFCCHHLILALSSSPISK
jgi:hypothetical protein